MNDFSDTRHEESLGGAKDESDSDGQGKGNEKAFTQAEVSLEAVINVLVRRGLCTEEELYAEESRLRGVRRTMAGLNFTPVQIKDRESNHQHHSLRRWASRRRWSRKLGTFIFGWKWRKIKKSSDYT